MNHTYSAKNHVLPENRTFWRRFVASPLLRVLVLCLALGLGAAAPAWASHFRYGSLTWRTVSSDPTKRTIEFDIRQAYRLSLDGFTTLTPGSVVNMGKVQFGDGTSGTINLTVTAVDPASDNFYGEAKLTHTYAKEGNYQAYFSECCRLSTLGNNANGRWYISSLVNAGSGNSSPVSSLAPIVNLATGQPAASFLIPVSDPDGDVLTFSAATSADINNLPFTNAPGLSVDATTGLVTFNTAALSPGEQYNAAVKVSDGKTSILLDFIITITTVSTAPVFDYSVTPANGAVLQASPGQPLTFGVRATDADANDQVRLVAFGLPLGASTSPVLPANGNPVQTTFTWTPTTANVGTTVINFVAQDLAGVQTSSSVTIVVSLRPVFDVPPTPASGSLAQVVPGTALRYTIQASDPDATDAVSIVSANGLPTGATLGNTLPTVAANPVQTQLSWTPVLANWGPHTVTFTARDTHNDQATHTLKFLVNSAPSFTSRPSALRLTVGQPFRYTISTTDADLPYGDKVQVEPVVLPSWLTLVDNGNGTATLSGTPTAAQVGRHAVTLGAEDIYHHGNAYGDITQSFVIEVLECATRLTATGTNPNCSSAASGSIALRLEGATAPIVYAWSGPNGYQSGAQNPTGLRAGTYAVTATDANGCSASTRVTLSAPAPAATPVVTVSVVGAVYPQAQPNTIYLGYGPQTATLTATGGVSYRWSPATNLSNATSANPVFTPTAGGTFMYTLTATNAAGCSASTTVTLRVLDIRCGNNPNNPKVLVCHNGHEICISPNAVPAHLRHDDKHDDVLGGCTSGLGQPVAGPATKQPIFQAPVAVVFEAFPNPLTVGSSVHFRSATKAPATVRVYNQMGYLVATLFDGVAKAGNDYRLPVNSARWPSGIYMCRIVCGGQTSTQRLMVTR